MKKMLKYFFSLLIIIVSLSASAQKSQWQSLSLGVDVSRFIVPVIDSTRFCWEITSDYEALHNMFIAGEIGFESTEFNHRNYNYSANGFYTRLGVDYNFMDHVDEGNENEMIVGVRYAFTTFTQQANNIRVRNDVWTDYTGGRVVKEFSAANWLEVTAGMRAHLFNNFFMGWTIHGKFLIWGGSKKKMQPYNIPGYGRSFRRSWVGLNYSIYYRIPIKKRKIPTPDNQK